MLVRTEETAAVVDYLRQRFLINENIIGVIENMPGAEIWVDDIKNPKGVLVKKDDYMHYVYTEDEAFLEDLCSNYLSEGFFGFSGVQGQLAEKIRSRYMVTWESPCTLYYMPKENLDLSLKKNPTSPIKLEDAETVDQFYQYRGPETLEIIRRDITKRPSSAVYVDGDMACWVLIHDDNSMGIMYTKEEYRRRGYAVDVTIDLASQIIEAGRIPFIQIVKGNSMSPGLAEKCGFVEAGKADWFGIIAGTPKELIEANDRSRRAFLESLPMDVRVAVYQKNSTYIGFFNALYSFKRYPAEEGVRLVKVESDAQRQAWGEITRYGLQRNQAEVIDKNALNMLLENPDMNMYLLYKGENAVGASTTHKYEEEDRGLYMLSILPQYQSSALLKILISETLHTEWKSGCWFMVAQAALDQAESFRELCFRESHQLQVTD